MQGTLYLCATPIGNLQDISLRALEILKKAPLIAAEDTRHTIKLLNYFEIKTPLTSYHKHNEKGKAEELITHLKSGKDLVVVSDAGLPGISDPGEILVKRALQEGIPVDVIPGPSALTTGLVLSGLPSIPLYFAGFLPNSGSERKEIIKKMRTIPATWAFYESPHRLAKLLKEAREVCGNVEVVITRELTKLHQQVIRGNIDTVLESINREPIRGEMVVFFAPIAVEHPVASGEWVNEVDQLVKQGMDKKEAIKALAEKFRVPKREIYNYLVEAGYK